MTLDHGSLLRAKGELKISLSRPHPQPLSSRPSDELGLPRLAMENHLCWLLRRCFSVPNLPVRKRECGGWTVQTRFFFCLLAPLVLPLEGTRETGKQPAAFCPRLEWFRLQLFPTCLETASFYRPRWCQHHGDMASNSEIYIPAPRGPSSEFLGSGNPHRSLLFQPPLGVGYYFL